jgi:nitrite reductase/ring-hydroxylating ferredoxin subunit
MFWCISNRTSFYDARMTQGDWTPAATLDDVPEERATRVEVDGTAVLLYRASDRVFAIGDRCTHQGAPLHRGRVRVAGSEATVTCPAHGSVFGLVDGRVLRAPAPGPVPAYETRVTDGTIEIKPRPEGRKP